MTLIPSQRYMNRNNIKFGFKIAGDFGTSPPLQGSAKCSILSDNGETIFSTEKDVKDESLKLVCPDGIKSSDDYVNGIITCIHQFVGMAKGNIANLKGNDQKLSGVVLNAPCQVINNIGNIIPNLKDPQGNSLKGVDFGKVKSDVLNSKDMEVDKSNFKFLATNDLPGAAAGVAKILASRGMLKDGFDFSVIMTGGGCGIAEGKCINNSLQIVATELGHIKPINKEIKTQDENIEKHGASAPALIRNYFKELSKLDYEFKEEDIDTLVKIGKSQLVLEHHVKITPDSLQWNELLDTGLYEEKEEGERVITKSGKEKGLLESTKKIEKKDHEKASKKAIEKYIDSIAQLCQIEVAKGTNLIVLTGPLASRIRDYTVKHSDDFDQKSLSELIEEKTTSYMDQTLVTLADSYKFKVVTDIEVPDNTIGGGILLKGEQISPKTRGNWIEVPLAALN